MKKELIPLTKEKRLVVIESCLGNLSIRPIDEPIIRIKGDTYQYEETEEGYLLNCQSDLTLYIFPEMTVKVQECQGDVSIKAVAAGITLGNIHGRLVVAHGVDIEASQVHGGVVAKHMSGSFTAGVINGDLVSRHTGAIHIQEIHGDARIKHISGDVAIQSIQGDSSFTHINGGVVVNNSMHDVHLNHINGPVHITTHGDIRLKYELPPGAHHLNAQQDVVVYWPAHHPITVMANAARVTNRFEFDDVTEKDNQFVASLGKKGPELNINAGAALVFKRIGHPQHEEEPFDFHFEFDFGQEAEALGSRMATLGEEIASKVSHKMAEITSQLEGQFKAMRKKEEAVRRASERMSRYGVSPPTAPAPPRPPKPADSEAVADARLKVLQILEEGKISVDEANTLLKALE